MRAGGGDPVARAAVRLSTELLGLLPTLAASPLQALARMHTLAAKGVADDDDLGRPARRRGAAAGCSDLGPHPVRARPPRPALVVAAVVHAELATAAPFVSHNGLVARAAERLVLVARGVDAEVADRARGRPPRAAPRSTSRTCAATATAAPAGVHALAAVRRRGLRRGRRGQPADAG